MKLATWKKYSYACIQIEDFIRWKFKKNDYPLEKLKMQFLNNFEYYLKTERNQKQVTINKCIQRLRKPIKIALSEGFLVKDPFALYKPGRVVKEVVFLKPDELSLLESYAFKQKSYNSTNRDTYSELYNFYLDTTNVQFIDNGYLKSYAMPIVREHWEDGFLENYIITFYQDGSYTQWITKYLYDNAYPNGFDMEKTEITVIDDPNLISTSTLIDNCPPHLIQYSWDDNAGDYIDFNCTAGDDHPYGDNTCSVSPGHPNAARRVYFGGWVASGCSSGGGVPGGGQSGDPESGGGQGGIGPGTPSDPDEFCLEDCPPVIPIIGPIATPCNTPAGSGFVNDKGECVVPVQIIKDPSFEGTKADCVYEDLKSNVGGFAKAIRKFDGEFPVSHLKFDLKNLGSSKKGQTAAPFGANSPDFVITISLNNNNSPGVKAGILYRPNLMIAKTIIHEVIHAEMYRKLMSLTNEANFNLVTRSQLENLLSNGDYPGIYDFYRRYRSWQHPQMATFYRETIARMLQEYDTGIPVGDDNTPDQFYLDISWEGLRYDAIPGWDSLGTEQTRIGTVIDSYIEDNKYENCIITN